MPHFGLDVGPLCVKLFGMEVLVLVLVLLLVLEGSSASASSFDWEPNINLYGAQ